VRGEDAGAAITDGDDNSLLGYKAGSELTTGSKNVIIGSEAARGTIDSGTGNVITPFNDSEAVIIGYRAGEQSTGTNMQAVFVGRNAGRFTTGVHNTFFGSEAGEDNTTGHNNTFVGHDAGKNNTTGYENVFVGESAGVSNTTGFRNLFIGLRAGVGRSGRTNESWGSTAVGEEALSETETHLNTAAGAAAGFDVGDQNGGFGHTLLGSFSGRHSERNNFNTFIGSHAGWDNGRTNQIGRGDRNTVIGAMAMYTNREGNDNTLVGSFSGSGLWGPGAFDPENYRRITNAGEQPETAATPVSGDNNESRRTALGAQSRVLRADTVAIGYQAEATSIQAIAIGNRAKATHTNSIALGVGAVSHGNNMVVLANDDTVSIDPGADNQTSLGTSTHRFTNLFAEAATVAANANEAAILDLHTKDGALAENRWEIQARANDALAIRNDQAGNNDLLSVDLAGNVTVAGDVFVNSDVRLKSNVAPIQDALDLIAKLRGVTFQWRAEKKDHYGFIAQEVEETLPDLVITDSEGIKSVNYQGLIPVLVEASKDLHDQNQQLEKDVANEAQEIAKLRARLQQQRAERTRQFERRKALEAEMFP